MTGMSRNEAMNEIKQNILDAAGYGSIDKRLISWDAIAYKIVPSVIEFVSQMRPGVETKFSDTSFSIMASLQGDIIGIVKRTMAELRANNEGLMQIQGDEYVSDCSVFFETVIAAGEDPMLTERIKALGDSALIKYVAMMQPVFAAGYLPGALTPCKLLACQDVVSAAEIRATINKIASEQILQKTETIDNPNVRHRMKVLADENVGLRARWSKE